MKGWTCEESGWWTHPKHGGVCREHNGWFWWPLDDTKPGKGPFRRMGQAIKAALKGNR